MDIIELERWKPSETDPRRLEYAGQPTAESVFQELKYRLESMGYLPDEYFLIGSEWENGRKIPKGANIFCTTDYGFSEGVYLDVYLKRYDDEQNKSITKKFITGKTLGENGNDLDRMFLISSAITKAFHGDHATHARYMKIGGVEDDTGGAVVHLSQREHKVIIEALVEQRERQEQAMSQTEQLLRRMTGSITEYVNTVGMLPLRMSDYDKAVLAIRDGELSVFQELYPTMLKDHADGLLIETAGRPGAVGQKMTALMLADVGQFSEPAYRNACEKAIDIADAEKLFFLLEQACSHVENFSPSFHGVAAAYAYTKQRFLARMIIQNCTDEQIAAAPSRLMELCASEPDERMLETLVRKGISGGDSVARTLYMLTYKGRHSHVARDLLKQRMWVNVNDYLAFYTCIQNDAVDVCKLLLDGGMDFDKYQQWAKKWNCANGHEETIQALADYWAEMQAEMEQAGAPEMGGQTFG